MQGEGGLGLQDNQIEFAGLWKPVGTEEDDGQALLESTCNERTDRHLKYIGNVV